MKETRKLATRQSSVYLRHRRKPITSEPRPLPLRRPMAAWLTGACIFARARAYLSMYPLKPANIQMRNMQIRHLPWMEGLNWGRSFRCGTDRATWGIPCWAETHAAAIPKNDLNKSINWSINYNWIWTRPRTMTRSSPFHRNSAQTFPTQTHPSIESSMTESNSTAMKLFNIQIIFSHQQ